MNLDVRSVGTTRPLRGVAFFDEAFDFTDEDAQEATIRACHSVNPGIIIVGTPRTVTKNHFEFCMHFVSKGYCVLCERAHSAWEHGGLWLRAGGWDVLGRPALSAHPPSPAESW